MDIKLAVLSVAFVSILSYIIFKLMDEAKNIDVEKTKDRFIENSKYIERKIEEMVAVDEKKLLKKYRDMMQQSILSRYYVNLYMLAALSAVIATIVYGVTSKFFNQATAGMLLAGVAFILPFFLLEVEVALNNRKIRQHMPHFLLMFLQTCDVMGDSIKALQSIRENIKEPIRGYIKEFLLNLSRGKSNKEAIRILKLRSTNKVWHSFCDNLYSDLEYGKMIQTEIENDIKDAFSHQENYMHRLTENTGSLTSMGIILVICGVGIQRVTAMNPDFLYIIRNNAEGHVVVNVVIVILIIVGWLARTSIAYTDD